eukprot:Tamp_11084.p2 GENE.Tamp_11084~~Tamp_11084.p2  ORF type:complete len:166 (+),score=21.69 Tamp_11084:1325-1822(+)
MNRTMRTRNMPLCPSCRRVNVEDVQEGAAAAIEKARSLLQAGESAQGDAAPRLPVAPPATSLHSHASSAVAGGARAASRLGPDGTRAPGDGEVMSVTMRGGHSKPLNGERDQDGEGRAWDPSGGGRGLGEGRRGCIKMEDGSLLPVDPRTGRVLAESDSGGLQLL